MIEFIKEWANQIIIVAIIATILEMILPNGNNKKYIKMVIGLYILFSIIGPITAQITGKNLSVLNFNYEKYFDKEILETSVQDFENSNSKLIKQAYIDNIKEDINMKLNKIGYEIIMCDINILEDENKEEYGTIQSINLKVNKKVQKTEETRSTIEVEDVEVGINNSDNNNSNIKQQLNVSNDEKKQIIEYLSEEYSVDKKNILIN